MKEKLILLCTFFASLFSNAQTLTADNSTPVIGEEFTFDYTVLTDELLLSAGEGKIWNYSNLQLYGIIITTVISNPDAVNFPDCSFALATEDRLVCYSANNSRIEITGYKNNNSQSVALFEKKPLYLSFPISYNTLIVDTIKYQMASGLSTATLHADATGTLQTPHGTYQNVLRVKTIHEQSTSFIHETYNWFAPGIYQPIITYERMSLNQGPFAPVRLQILKEIRKVEVVTAIHHESRSKSIFPNPVSGIVHLIITPDKMPAEVTITDLFGVALLTQKPLNSTIDVNSLPAGLYYLNWIEGSDKIFEKLIVCKP